MNARIVDFYELYYKGIPSQKIDRVLMSNRNFYTGIVLGTSHAIC